MQIISISETNFDFEGFTTAIITSVNYFSPEDADSDIAPDLLIGTNSKGDILFMDKNDLYTTDNKLTVDVIKIQLKAGFSICFPFTNIFAEIEESGYLTCADGNKYKIETKKTEEGWLAFKDPNAPEYYDTCAYGYLIRYEKGNLVIGSGLRHNGEDGVEEWEKGWKEIDNPMEKFLKKFMR
jgi:hypothetical protein